VSWRFTEALRQPATSTKEGFLKPSEALNLYASHVHVPGAPQGTQPLTAMTTLPLVSRTRRLSIVTNPTPEIRLELLDTSSLALPFLHLDVIGDGTGL